jgi:hypothetical protein
MREERGRIRQRANPSKHRRLSLTTEPQVCYNARAKTGRIVGNALCSGWVRLSHLQINEAVNEEESIRWQKAS